MERSKAAAITAKHRERLRDRYRLPITVQQRETQRDPGHAGFPLWTSHVVLPKPAGSSVLQSLLQVIRCLGDGRETFSVPDVRSVEGEWLGWRRRRVDNDDLKKMPEKAMFDNMMKDTTNRLTILFIHGGAF